MQIFLYRLLATGFPLDTSPLPRSGVNDPNLVTDIFNLVFGLLIAIAFISVVYGGFKYVISKGDPNQTAKAKDIILYSLIGLVISLAAFSIVSLVLRTVG